jgi:hypothetical protein
MLHIFSEDIAAVHTDLYVTFVYSEPVDREPPRAVWRQQNFKPQFYKNTATGYGLDDRRTGVPVSLVRERTIPTERPPLVGAKLVPTSAHRGLSRIQSGGSPTAVSRPKPLLLLSSSSPIVLTGLSGPRSKPTTSQKIW